MGIEEVDIVGGDDISELEAESAQVIQEEQKQEVEVQAEPEIPEKYRGKSVADIAKMHEEAEKALSKQGYELGEVRRLADELLKSNLNNHNAEESEPEVDFFENPKEAVRRAVENNPKVIAAEQMAIQSRQEQVRKDLAAKHPDFGQIVQDPEFVEWVKSSNNRIKTFQRAEAYDVDAADDLLSTFKQIRAVKVAKTQAVDNTARDATLKAASVETGGTNESSKKVYRRADLIRLKMLDPNRYDSMNDEIILAYSEGRVR